MSAFFVYIDDILLTMREDRMFTSRSEYRMTIRSDNADLRLTQKGKPVGIHLHGFSSSAL